MDKSNSKKTNDKIDKIDAELLKESVEISKTLKPGQSKKVSRGTDGKIVSEDLPKYIKGTDPEYPMTEEEMDEIFAEWKEEQKGAEASRKKLEDMQHRKELEKAILENRKLVKEEKKLTKQEEKQARYTAKKEKIALAKINKDKPSHKLRNGIIIAAIVAGGLTLAGVAHNNKEPKPLLDTTSAEIMLEHEDKLAKTYTNKEDLEDVLSIAKDVQSMYDDGSYKDLTQEQINELAEETKDATGHMLKEKVRNYYNDGRKDYECSDGYISIYAKDEGVYLYPNAGEIKTNPEPGKMLIVDTDYTGYSTNYADQKDTVLMQYEPSGNDAYEEYADLCIAIDNGTVSFNDITEALDSTLDNSQYDFDKKFLGGVEKGDSVITRKERKEYAKTQEAKDQSTIEVKNDSEELEYTVLSSEDVDLDLDDVQTKSSNKDRDDEER